MWLNLIYKQIYIYGDFMCTAINFNGYFGRNLDLDVEFENKVE